MKLLLLFLFVAMYLLGAVFTLAMAAAYANHPVRWYEIVFWPLTFMGLFRDG